MAEGNFSQESDPHIIEKFRVKGKWSPEYVQRICQTLQHRHLPFLLDMGGRPGDADTALFQQCTHAVLLLKTEEPEASQLWSRLLSEHNVQLLARLHSQLEGNSVLNSLELPIEGNLVGLLRGKDVRVQGPVFEALVECISTLFKSYSIDELEQTIFEQAPSELLNLYNFVPSTGLWDHSRLPTFLQSLPTDLSFSVYGRAPNWVYTALATHIESHYPLYLYAQRSPSGWLQPVPIRPGAVQSPDLQLTQHHSEDMSLFEIQVLTEHLDYFQPEPFLFPSIQPGKGLILSGKLPQWLLTALARFYKEQGALWLAFFEPRFSKSVVTYSRTSLYQPGDLVEFPGYLTH